MRHDVLCGDAREVLKDIPTASCDALVTDPPAGVSFMNLAFDSDKGGRDQWVAWLAGILAECRRVVKPGGYALVWALPRTSHWTGMALEEAGWTIRDSLHHLQGAGFPKSRSCLKPAHEVWWLAKAPGPLQPLRIDACRVPTAEIGSPRAYEPRQDREQWRITGGSTGSGATSPAGRYPSNLVLSHVPPAPDGTGGCRPAGVRRVKYDRWGKDRPITVRTGSQGYGSNTQPYSTTCYADADGCEQVQSWQCVDGCPVKALDEQAGPRTSGGRVHRRGDVIVDRWHEWQDRTDTHRRGSDNAWEGSTGAASRFFPTFAPDPEDAVPFHYCPKASRRDRGDGNTHCTVKPTALMAWLCRLVCRSGGTILDPFCGSGSTLVACVREGMGFIGIDAEPAYVEIALRRVAHEQEQQTGPLFAGVSAASK